MDVLASDSQPQFIESRADAVSIGHLDGDLVVAAANVLNEGVTGDQEVHKAARQGVFRLKTSLGIHSTVRPDATSTSQPGPPQSQPPEGQEGYIECHAKIGKVMIPNKRPLLHTYFRADIRRLHHKRGFNACVWRLPKHSHTKWVIEHLDVITGEGAGDITARVRVKR